MKIARVALPAKKYAEVIFSLPLALRSAVISDLSTILSILSSDAVCRRFFLSDLISREQSKILLKKLSASIDMSSITIKILLILFKNRRLAVLPDILTSLHAMEDTAAGCVDAELQSSCSLSLRDTKLLEKNLSIELGKAVRLQTKIDPTLLSGGILFFNNKMFDMSFKTMFFKLRQRMNYDTHH